MTILDLFSEKGLTGEGWAVKLRSPTRVEIRQTGDDVLLSFTDYPLVSVTKKIKILGNITFSRELEGIRVTDKRITLMLNNCPDISFDYGEDDAQEG